MPIIGHYSRTLFMCGISVIIDPKNQRIDEREIKIMNNSVGHRGPDGEGYYYGDHFAFGHRMLKITDFSLKGRQPMSYRDYVIIHNGEVYNFKELRENLKRNGYEFETISDTEVIMAAYDKWGQDCVKHFTGMWSFVIFDAKRKILFCSRDRFGIKPFFYTQLQQRLLIGSEIKQLKNLPGFKPKINQSAAFDFLYNGKISDTRHSFFEGVYFLPAGHNMVYDLQSHAFLITQWYDVNRIRVNKEIGFEDAKSAFNQLFTESILLQGESRLPVAACLSGGLDSTSIVGVSEKIKNKLTTFSSCYVQPGYNEIEYINNAVIHYGFANYKNYPNPHDLVDKSVLNKIVYHQDQPILSGSFFSEYKVFENVAAKKIRVVLSGQGADEYLGGYGEFTLLNLLGLWRRTKLKALARELKNTSDNQDKTLKEIFKSFIIFGTGLSYFEKIANEKALTAASNWLNKKWIHQNCKQSASSFNITGYASLSDLSKDALINYSLPHQLHSEDRNSMLHSVESRLPFLDHRLVEHCLGLPDNFIIKKGVTKRVLRESLKNVLPDKIYDRHIKLGFPCPEESLFVTQYEFIQQEFRYYVHQLPHIFSAGLPELHQRFISGKIPYDNILFRALSFGTWAREFGLIEPAEKSRKMLMAQ